MKLKMKTRLIAAFAILIAMTAAVSVVSFVNSAAQNARIENIVNINFRRVVYATRIAENIQFVTKREKDLILTDNTTDMEGYISQIDSRNMEIAKDLKDLESISSSKGVEIIRSFEGFFSGYKKQLDEIKSLAKINTDSANQEAIKISSTLARSNALNAVDAIKQIVAKNLGELAEAKTEADAAVEQANRLMLFIVLFSIIFAGVLGLYIVRSIQMDLGGDPGDVAKIVGQIAQGNLTLDFKNTNGKPNVGLLKSVEEMTEKLKEIIGLVISGASNISTASKQMSDSSLQMSQGATEQASSVEEVSSSMEQMVATILQNSSNSEQTNKIAAKAVTEIVESSVAVEDTIKSMKAITDKISIIGEITRQTNILALNAAVEAARAGEHGRGFAVVAAEVRKLAERSSASAVEINSVSSKSVETAQRSGELLKSAVPGIQKTSELVQEITAASVEQNGGAEQINSAIQQLNYVVQQNAAIAEEMAASAEELNAQADQLRSAISFFNVDSISIDGNDGTKKADEKKSIMVQRPQKVEEEMVRKKHTLASFGQKTNGKLDVGNTKTGQYEML
jgi:methyl-accepting chemotaxis protein